MKVFLLLAPDIAYSIDNLRNAIVVFGSNHAQFSMCLVSCVTW